MIGREDRKISIDNFQGLYSRGSVDEVPQDHLQDCLNLQFTSEGRIQSRKGLSRLFTTGYGSGIRRFFLTSRMKTNARESAVPGKVLILDDNYNFYLDTGSSPIYTLSGVKDFAAMNIANRTFISPNDGSLGMYTSKILILNTDSGTVRAAAGGAPEQSSSFFTATGAVATGSVPAGEHKFAVVYETDTGFWTPPGIKKVVTVTLTPGDPVIVNYTAHGMVSGESHRLFGGTGNWTVVNDFWEVTRIDDDHFSIPLDSTGLGSVTGTIQCAGTFTPATVTAIGGRKVTLTNIPTGGSQVVKRLILATRAGEEEYFFVPDKPGSQGVIHDNSTTTATVDFEDTDLVDSADYLFDIYEAIPSGSALCKYAGRLVVAGIFPDFEKLILSEPGDFETFNRITGVVQIQTERDGNGVRNCFVLRDTLYAAKFVGMFAVEDNGQDPTNWKVSLVDGAVGAYNYGTSSFTVSQPTPDTGDIVLLASRAGLYLFDGVVRRPELTYKVQSIWLRINFAAFHRVTVAHDIWNHRIYIAMPLDSATEPNYLLVGDYSDGRDFSKIRWCPWQFHKNPTVVGMMYSTIDGDYRLRVGSLDSSSPYMWSLDPAVVNDDTSNAINAFATFAPLSFELGAINFFKFLNLRVTGLGNLTFTLTGEDGVATPSPTPGVLAMTASPGKELQRQINLVNEKMNLKLQVNAVDKYITNLDRVDVWGLPQWPVRPNV